MTKEDQKRQIIYAIGDIHGRDDLLEDLHRTIYGHHHMNHSGQDAVLVYVGDYIDGGRFSREALDRVREGLPGFSSVCLLGNHEDLLLKCTESDDRDAWANWLANGGETTLTSFGLSTRFGRIEPSELCEALGSDRLAWLKNLPLTLETDSHFFVHAGIAPGVPFSEQVREDLLWIRGRFLDSNQDHGKIVVHGHTPVAKVDCKANRINLDTGATLNNLLSAVKISSGELANIFTATSHERRTP